MAKKPIDVDTWDFRWFIADVTYSPTTLDPEGCDGLYVKDIHVKWFGWPIAVFYYISGMLKSSRFFRK